MSLVLSEAGLASDAAFTVKEHFSTTPGLSSLPEVHNMHGSHYCRGFRSLQNLVAISRRLVLISKAKVA